MGELDCVLDLDTAVANVSGGDVPVHLNDCSTCPADIDDNGAVDFGDILAVLVEWGPCERVLGPARPASSSALGL